jgi:hypothetical protein
MEAPTSSKIANSRLAYSELGYSEIGYWKYSNSASENPLLCPDGQRWEVRTVESTVKTDECISVGGRVPAEKEIGRDMLSRRQI